MSTPIPDTQAAAGTFPVVAGPVTHRVYNPLPAATVFPAGTLAYDAVAAGPRWTDGTLQVGSILHDSTSNMIMAYQPAEIGSLVWAEWFTESANPGGGRKDQVWRQGWNVNRGGGLIATGTRLGGMSWEME